MTAHNHSPGNLIPGISGMSYGCDYNPEQWDEATWHEDVTLMRDAGVNLVAINIFGWAAIQPTRDTMDFTALDTIMDLLHTNGIAVNLGTGTASPPPWLTTEHPEILPITADGTTRYPGGRQAYCPSSPVFRDYASALVTAVAQRYSTHPALAMWHVSNELGCHNALCHNPETRAAFHQWLTTKYTTIDALNAAWGTAFWSQRYSSFDQIRTPMDTLSSRNPGQVLDFHRFSSDELLSLYLMEKDIITQYSDKPVTTNFMVTAHIRNMDYWTWAPHMDVIANDHYLDHRLTAPTPELSFAADLTRGLAQGNPWMLMEHSTGAVNWQPLNVNKAPGEMARNSLTHVARGADSLCFFQWRASVQGSEKYHSAMLPHAGTNTQRWREVVDLGATMKALAPVAGSRVDAHVAVLFEWESWWAGEGESRPSQAVTYLDQVHSVHRALRSLGVVSDVVSLRDDLSTYDLVIVPGVHVITPTDAEHLTAYTNAGGHVVVTYWSGIVDANDRVYQGGYPGALRELLGVRVEEFSPVPAGDTLTLTPNDTSHAPLEATLWTENLHTVDSTPVFTFSNGPHPGVPAVTTRTAGQGTTWYVATQLTDDAWRHLLTTITTAAGVTSEHQRYSASGSDLHNLEIVRRIHPDSGRTWVFVINHATTPATLNVTGHDITTGTPVTAEVTIEPGAVHIIEEDEK